MLLIILTHLLLLVTLLSHLTTTTTAHTGAAHELPKGFSATPDSSTTSFQTLLSDSFGNYSLGFLRVNKTHLALAVIHVPSKEPLWIANANRLARWSDQTRLSFNGSLVISDPHTGVFWSSYTDGDILRISNTSNLLIEKIGDTASVLWQSFQFPDDTLMENQNFTSDMTLVSSNGVYSMKLGSDFIAFFADFKTSDHGQMYLKHKPLEAKAHVIEDQGPIRIILSSDGFLGMFQNESTPVDVQPFSSFQQEGSGNRRIRLEPDGNLIGYYWTGSSWVVDFKQISDPCELPSTCGSYGVCHPGKGCSCLDDQTEYTSDRCDKQDAGGGDFCGMIDRDYRVLRKHGVELPYKEIMAYTIKSSLEKCESECEEMCTCWGAVYSNTSGFCYTIDYPIQTLVGVEDEAKMGYFKVKEGGGKKKKKKKMVVWLVVGAGFLCWVVLIFLGVMGVIWKGSSRQRRKYVEEEGVGGGVGPYRDLGSTNLKSLELSQR